MKSLKNYGLKAVALINMDQEYGPMLKWEKSFDGETSIQEMLTEFYTMFMVGMHRDIVPKAIVFEDKNVVVSSYIIIFSASYSGAGWILKALCLTQRVLC
ncbi:MAG TPA: hypothetical protein ENF90_00120, partial [Candidatus Bathyarchaeota archaeon]|nr:hypothetical protein [Candidatus Bathyarchaeota archaeon]